MLEVGILETHLSKENKRLALLDLVLSLSINDLGKVKHLPGLLKVARLLGLLAVGLHLVLASLLFRSLLGADDADLRGEQTLPFISENCNLGEGARGQSGGEEGEGDALQCGSFDWQSNPIYAEEQPI